MQVLRVGDIVMYKQAGGIPSRSGVYIHPAIITRIVKDDLDSLDLTVFFHGYSAEPVMSVPMGNPTTDPHCWWLR